MADAFRNVKLLLSSLIGLALVSCAVPGSTPDGSKSKYMETVFAGVSLKKGEMQKPFSFKATVVLLEGAPDPAYATFLFDNPEQPSRPFIVKAGPARKNKIGEPILGVETPRFERVSNGGTYTCKIDLFSDAARTRSIDHLSQEFRVTIAPGLADALGIADKLN